LRYSEDLSQSNWVKTNTGTGVAPTVTANYAISPDGSQNASRVQFDINGGTTISDRSRLYQDAGTGTSGNQAYSVYVKSNDSSSHTIVFRALGGAFNVKTVTTEWQRIDMAATDNSFYFELGLYGDSATADTADILVWGAQMEEGSYATSYIPTEGSSVTRSAEEANGAGNSTVFNDSEGVLYAEIAALANDGGNRRLGISDGDLSDRVVIGFTSSDNQIQAVVSNSGTQANITHTTSDVLSYNKIAFKYKANDFALWVNGTEVGIDGNGTAPSGLNQALFNEGGGALDFYGKVKDFRLYDTALSDSELQALTS
jgi:phosphotransferase system IIB component